MGVYWPFFKYWVYAILWEDKIMKLIINWQIHFSVLIFIIAVQNGHFQDHCHNNYTKQSMQKLPGRPSVGWSVIQCEGHKMLLYHSRRPHNYVCSEDIGCVKILLCDALSVWNGLSSQSRMRYPLSPKIIPLTALGCLSTALKSPESTKPNLENKILIDIDLYCTYIISGTYDYL